MRSLCLVSLLVVGACGAGARYQAIGTGRTVVAGAPVAVGPGADATAGMPAAVALPADRQDSTYKVDFSVWLPRAMEVDWTVRCGASVQTGVVGERFEQYRERRLVALRGMIDQQRQTAATVGSIVGGAVIGQVQGVAQVETPVAQGEAGVAVDGAAVGAAVGASTVAAAPLELPPGDLGQGYRTGSVRVLVPEANPGACAMELAPREVGLGPDALAYLAGTFEVARLDDTAHWQAVRARKASIAVRVDLKARLVARGGDVELRWKQAEARRVARESAAAEQRRLVMVSRDERLRIESAHRTAHVEVSMSIQGAVLQARRSLRGLLTLRGADPGLRARLEADRASVRLRYEAERDARAARIAAEGEARAQRAYAQAQARLRFALDVRFRLRARLIGFGADPGLQARLAAEAQAARLQRDAQATAEAAAELEAWRIGAAISDQRAQHAIHVRAQLAAQLTSRGAFVRPPMPDPVDEMPGEPPTVGYAWASGEWQWSGYDWRWMNGHWVGPVTGGAVTTTTVVGGGAGVSVGGGAGVSIGGVTVTVGGGAGTTGTTAPPPRPQHQDHRPAPAPRPAPPPRPQHQDHR